MRLSELFLRIGVFALAAMICIIGARAAVQTVETRSVSAVQYSLEDRGLGFVDVIGDGLQVILEGEAPSEAQRFRAMSTAGTQVDASRVIDNMSVRDSAGIRPPDFSMEILRNDSGISVIGLIPSSSDQDGLAERLGDIAGGPDQVADLMEMADYAVPPGWNRALDYALRSLRQLPRSKISVRSDRVVIEAIADSDTERARLEADLRRFVPEGIDVTLDISAPRPVISPFLTRFVIDAEGARFDSCVADSDEAAQRILTAARASGLSGPAGCTVALGAPTTTWSQAVELSVKALAQLEAGTITLSDNEITLVAQQGASQEQVDRIAGELENALPDLFLLEVVIPAAPTAADEGPPQFTATRSPEGQVQLRGRVSDQLLNMTAENYAKAKFGSEDIVMGTRIVDGLPQGWSVRVLAAIEALSMLSNGAVIAEPGRISVRGNSGSEETGAQISRLLIEKLGETEDLVIDVTYVPELARISTMPSKEECLAEITTVTQNRKITFDPGSANISGEAIQVIEDIADILRRCAELRLEIAGYTDSQGREEMNLQLSQQRADAVLAALRMRRVPTSSFVAVGYGIADPIADNATEEGREANRRIEFSLISDESAEDEATTLEQSEDPEAAADDEADEPAGEASE